MNHSTQRPEYHNSDLSLAEIRQADQIILQAGQGGRVVLFGGKKIILQGNVNDRRKAVIRMIKGPQKPKLKK